ncbi:undecaprenyl-diphosphatase [Micromonospora pattaloongensis]|uniref:Undecaprenyl-diphosphatase n=1 Tax=Micromonospora pattaloongensis TaxID=405436 RepID=A0A1H3SQN6_9ACTN|nr:phosphatase PAP2 family protein [Micromonospora pattaloongensis]SDZ40393.1 undecaprenyl-diphosphatase [Micromonospora pattaloongensis]
MLARMHRAVPLLALAAFVLLLALVGAGWGPVQRLDGAVSEAARRYGRAHPGLVDVLRIATDVAATGAYLAAGTVLTVVHALRRRPRRAAFCAAVTVTIPVLWGLLHWLMYRPRPTDGFVVVTSNGFPSGHASNAAAAALAAVLLLWPRLRRAGRVAAVLVAAAFALFVAVTRVALLAHWPSDVVGGGLLALAVVPLLGGAVARAPRRPLRGRRKPDASRRRTS